MIRAEAEGWTAVLLEDWQRDGQSVVLLDGTPGRRSILVPGRTAEGTFREEVQEGAAVDPSASLWLPNGALAALGAAASRVVPPSAAQGEHLRDAIGVRDRLLTMIETRGIR